MGRLSDSRREWLPELSVLLGLAAVTTIVFAVTPLDVASARVFYRGGSAVRWPFARALHWSALYRAAPWITASLVLAGLGALAVGFARRRERLRREGTFLLLSVVLGPGLLVNTIFKDHWNRPRPREIEANVEVVLVDTPDSEITIEGELHGFGLPTSRLDTRVELETADVPTVRYRIVQSGWFTDLDGVARVRLPLGALERISVHLDRGNIRVTDETQGRAVTTGRVELDLRTGSGHVVRPQATQMSPGSRVPPRCPGMGLPTHEATSIGAAPER